MTGLIESWLSVVLVDLVNNPLILAGWSAFYNTHVGLGAMMFTGRPHEVEGNRNIIAQIALFFI